MKNIVYILLFLTNLTFGQTVNLTESEIEKYAKLIDKLREENRLVKVSYFNMSPCGGALDGYYLNNNLVLIEANFYTEFGGYSSKKFFIENDKYLKLLYSENYADQDTYYQKYPEDTIDIDFAKMTYIDTVYSIIFSHPTVFQKKTENKIITNILDHNLLERLVNCGQSMKLELQEVINQVDNLRFVKEMPYMCQDFIEVNKRHPLTIGCGDEQFWNAVRLNKNGIELLIDKLDDTTTTNTPVPLFGYYYTVADIAYTALQEIIHNIPTFDILGVPFDEDGCGYCSYWQYLNKDLSNRQKFKKSVWNWYHLNKKNFIWIEGNNFAICDCNGHPNGGHYELKTSTK